MFVKKVFKKLIRYLRKDVEMNEQIADLQAQIAHLSFLVEDIHNIQQEQRDYLSCEYLRYRNDTSKKKVLVCGYYGAQNCGDELMLRACLEMLDSSKLDITILLYNNYYFNPNHYQPYKTIHYPKSITDTDFLAEEFDAVIWGGGAVIDDTTSYFNGYHTNLSYTLIQVTQKMLSIGKKAFIFGVSSNQIITNQRYIFDLNYIIQNADMFSLRDTNSVQSLTAAGIDCSKIRLVDDLALSLAYTTKKNLPKADIGIILMPNRNNIEQTRSIIELVLNECNAILGKVCQVRFISFYNEHNNDIKWYETIAQKLNLSHYDIIDTIFTPEEVASVICSCNFIVFMRYHATLLSVLLGKKTLCINCGRVHPHYENKLQYIREHYCNTLCITDYEHFEAKHIRQALGTEIIPFPREKLSAIYENTKKLFDEACDSILN